MNALFYIASVVAVLATVMAISRAHPVHALLYFVVSLFAAAVVFFTLGAPFVAALEVIVYAGAIIVLFVFVVMLLNLGPATAEERSRIRSGRVWLGPAILAAVVAVELAFAVARGTAGAGAAVVSPREVGLALFGPYLMGVELASVLLLAGLVGAYHLGRRKDDPAGKGGAAS
jgi:NADH-quinone oxidoreductase subunit J